MLRQVHALADELATCDVVINCTGLGSRALLDDHDLAAVRGQVIVLTNPGLTSWWLNDTAPTELTYVVPRLETVVVGGTAERGQDDLIPDPATATAILSRAMRLVPALAEATVVGHRVGLRPARSEIRLEREEMSAGPVVHCYGHGGAGVTLSWGCAGEVVDLVGRGLSAMPAPAPASSPVPAIHEPDQASASRGRTLDVQHSMQPCHRQHPPDRRWHRTQNESATGSVGSAVRRHEHAETGRIEHGHPADVEDEITDPEVDRGLERAPKFGHGRRVHTGPTTSTTWLPGSGIARIDASMPDLSAGPPSGAALLHEDALRRRIGCRHAVSKFAET